MPLQSIQVWPRPSQLRPKVVFYCIGICVIVMFVLFEITHIPVTTEVQVTPSDDLIHDVIIIDRADLGDLGICITIMCLFC